MNIQTIPLALYIHVPWCVRKCPYCDFNSHARRESIPEQAFIDTLLADLRQDLPQTDSRPLSSIFIGGGTPSLLSPGGIERLLRGIGDLMERSADFEVTLEANPGTAEADRFRGYRDAGVNRLSIGIQSFGQTQLSALGRIHGAQEARAAARMARAAGFDNFNLDLMFGLPGQDLTRAREDVVGAIELEPSHISYYQLTLEPNTLFHQRPPVLPGDELIWSIQEQGQALLAAADYGQYEISAYARPGQRCRHNLNYWRFGDYIGIGPGAHGKLSLADGRIRRTWKSRDPVNYLAAAVSGRFTSGSRELDRGDRIIEFMMNALRLQEGFDPQLFRQRAGLPTKELEPGVQRARELGLLNTTPGLIRPTEKGLAFLNDLLPLFEAESTPRSLTENG